VNKYVLSKRLKYVLTLQFITVIRRFHVVTW